MNKHEELIEKFYTFFQKLDGRGMAACYHEDVFFYDPVFQDLQGDRAKFMWKMLCSTAKDLTVEFSDIKAEDDYGSCTWKATYLFSKTGRKVVNKVTARFKFQDDLIIEHMDDFDMWNWSRQALGLKGFFLGWTSAVKNKIRENAKKGLEMYIKRNALR